jgi:hypothetical protein
MIGLMPTGPGARSISAGATATLRTVVRVCGERGWLRGTLTETERVAALYSLGTPGTVQLVLRDLNLTTDAYQGWMRRTVD